MAYDDSSIQKEAAKYGIDLSLFEENLKKTVDECINAQSRAANAISALRAAKAAADE